MSAEKITNEELERILGDKALSEDELALVSGGVSGLECYESAVDEWNACDIILADPVACKAAFCNKVASVCGLPVAGCI